MHVLIANRGEIAVRIAATCAEMAIQTTAVFSTDDADSLHARVCDHARRLPGTGPAAYLAIDMIVEAALQQGCDTVHPGYGFLSESSAFARACEKAGLTFIGPTPAFLDVFGDKAAARKLAADQAVPVLTGSEGAVGLKGARALLAKYGAGGVMLKAVAGGGGRGMRPVRNAEDLDSAWERCVQEAENAFGSGELYVERLLGTARHIEVQIIGDGEGGVGLLGERECSLQRNRQKLIEWAPVEGVAETVLESLRRDSLAMAKSKKLRSLCTFEFLISSEDGRYYFIEANPRIQVEHTVTEELTGLDLVRLQMKVAGGAKLSDLGLSEATPERSVGMALQVRVNMELMTPDGVRPAPGTIETYSPPTGRGIRVDGYGYSGYTANPYFDSLLAKVIVTTSESTFRAVAQKAELALRRFEVSGVDTNIPFLLALLELVARDAEFPCTDFIDDHSTELISASSELDTSSNGPDISRTIHAAYQEDPINQGPFGSTALLSTMHGVLVKLDVSEGTVVHTGQEVAVVEAMKMQHGIRAEASGKVLQVVAQIGQLVGEGAPLFFATPLDVDSEAHRCIRDGGEDLDEARADLREVQDRRRGALDHERSSAVGKRHERGQRTARENVADLIDEGSFVEYGRLALAGRSGRMSRAELISLSPADGLITGFGTVNASSYGSRRSRIAVMAYDYTVFAGTQGARSHLKTDRLAELAHRWDMPLVLFAEGGGGRPGETESGGFIRAFELFAKLSGKVPTIGIASGRCFAGNAALLGCCDITIATDDVSLGMGGPAMIEGGGQGTFTPEEIGPIGAHVASGVIDLQVKNEASAVAETKRILSFFQGCEHDWQCADQRLLRTVLPIDRLRSYDIRRLINTLCDEDSVLELRYGYGRSLVTALARIEGSAVGILANDPLHLGGAIDTDSAEKAARFMRLCEARAVPLVSLSDTPGIMVGPEVERTGLVRSAAQMFITGANLKIPILSVVLRKSYGLGAIAMTGGSYQASLFTIAWPSGEFGGMGLEGAVKLGYRKELDAEPDAQNRQRLFDEMVARLYEEGKAVRVAETFGIDDVIDPADTRAWISGVLRLLSD